MSEEFDEEYEERRRRRNARNEEMRKRKKTADDSYADAQTISHCRDYTGCGNSYYKWKKHYTRNTGVSGSNKN